MIIRCFVAQLLLMKDGWADGLTEVKWCKEVGAAPTNYMKELSEVTSDKNIQDAVKNLSYRNQFSTNSKYTSTNASLLTWRNAISNEIKDLSDK